MAGQFINAPSPSRREARNFENELDIVIVGNKSDKNVTSGQYVTVRDSSISGITDGIYKATANVAAGTAFVAANLSAVTSGALNDLSGNLASVPTIVSNSNGVAFKFPSGLMICIKKVTKASVSITSSWGGCYEATDPINLGSWAESFTARPQVSLTVSSDTDIGCWLSRNSGCSKTSAGSVSPIRPTSTTGTVSIDVYGIGYWK